MTPGKQSSEYLVAKVGVAGVAMSLLLTTLTEAGVIGPNKELSTQATVIVVACILSAAAICATYIHSRGQAKQELRVNKDS